MHHFAQCFRLAGKACAQVYGVFRFVFLSCSIGFSLALSATAFAAEAVRSLDIKRQSLTSALHEISAAFDFNVSTRPVLLAGEMAVPFKGEFTARQAVDELLKGRGIRYEWIGDSLTIVARIVPKPPPQRLHVEPPKMIEEVAVVGSNIRGGSSASPVFRYGRDDIESSGVASTQEFMMRLPQVFGGGAAEGAVSSIKGEGATFNIADASGINLLGMGFDSTLVLLNGRRMAPVGFGDVVDVSAIPLGAIERIEVMTDGASAIYGSDAVGGVVNIILRQHYEGNETRVGYGDVTTGGGESYRFSHTYGKGWSSGNALFSYTYRQQVSLDTEDRSVTKSAADPSDLMPELTQHDAVFSLSQQLTDHADFYVEALYGVREPEQKRATLIGDVIVVSRSVERYSLVTGGGIDFGDTWRLDTSILHSGSSLASETTGAFSAGYKTALDTWVLDAKADGEIFQVWGGSAKLAIGGQYRREAFDYRFESSSLSARDKSARSIGAVFAELFVPLIGEGNGLPGVERLEFTFAGRYEKYDDFGSSTTPKTGLLWSPVAGLNLRATYSKSFRAPLLFELSEVVFPRFSRTLLLSDSPAPDSELIPTLFVVDSNANLQSETATSRTLGIDITPAAWSGFRLSLTYFDIDFSNRIQRPFQGFEPIENILINPRYAPVVIRNPDMNLINFWVSQPNFSNPTGVNLDEIGALFDNTMKNIETLHERGFDFNLRYLLDTSLGEFTFELGGTYLLSMKNQLKETGPFYDILNTAYNPVDLKMRNSISWKRNNVTATMFANYVGSYKDIRFGQERDINAWTTVDLNIRYEMDQRESSWWRGTTISLSVSNFFDKPPPYVADAAGYNFDAANGNAVGRRISLDFIKMW